MATESSFSEAIELLNKAPEFSELAARYGPFFFGVFVLLVAFVLILLNKNKVFCSIFAFSGLALCVWASLIHFGIGNPIHAYTIRLGNLKKDHSIVLTDRPPILYKHNKVLDIERDSCHVDMAAISPIKLTKAHRFNLIIKEKQILNSSEGTEETVFLKHNLSLPFNGQAHSIYYLERVVAEDDEGVEGYRIKEISGPKHDAKKTDIFNGFFNGVAYAAEDIPRLLDSSIIVPAEIAKPSKINCIYFRRAADRGNIEAALEKEKIPYLLRNSSVDKPANAVWIGKDIPGDTAKRIGLALLEQGVKLQHFGYFYNSDSRTNVIQIGYSRKKQKANSITRDDIINFTTRLATIQDARQIKTQEKRRHLNRYYKLLWKQQKQQQQQRK